MEPPTRDDDAEERSERLRSLEGFIRDTLRRAIEKGVQKGAGTISRADSAIRGVVDEVKLPREIVGYLFSQVDDTKNALVRGVAHEIRDFLDATDLATELRRALTSLSFEIKTEIRFTPNDAGVPKPSVRSRVRPRRQKRTSEPPRSESEPARSPSESPARPRSDASSSRHDSERVEHHHRTGEPE